jgi:hypothetical protein
MNSILLNTGILSNGKIGLFECTALSEINDALIFSEVADAQLTAAPLIWLVRKAMRTKLF